MHRSISVRSCVNLCVSVFMCMSANKVHVSSRKTHLIWNRVLAQHVEEITALRSPVCVCVLACVCDCLSLSLCLCMRVCVCESLYEPHNQVPVWHFLSHCQASNWTYWTRCKSQHKARFNYTVTYSLLIVTFIFTRLYIRSVHAYDQKCNFITTNHSGWTHNNITYNSQISAAVQLLHIYSLSI